MLHDQGVAHSKLSSVGIAHHDATCRTSSRRRVRVIARSAASAPVHEKGTPSTHLRWLLGVQIEGARTLNGLMHHVHAGGQLVSRSRERPHVRNTLLGRVVVPFTLPRVAVSVDGISSRSPTETTSVLVVVVGQG